MNCAIPSNRNEFAEIESVNKYLKKARTPATLKNWKYSLYDFFEFINIHPNDFIKIDKTTIEDIIESYVDHLKNKAEQNEINPNSIITLVHPIKKFLIFNRVESMNDAWVRLKANFPNRKRSIDEKYNEIELQKIYNIADFREKALLGLMMSGMRVGAVKDICYSHLIAVEDFASVRVYAGANEEYHTFITPQAYGDIKAYLAFRERSGEKITSNSPLIRNDFRPERAGVWIDVGGKKHGGPEPLRTTGGIATIIINLARRAGVLTNSHNSKTRHRIMSCHGLRKLANVVCKASGMDSERVEMIILGHAVSSLAGHYWRMPSTESEMSPQEKKLFQTIKSEYRRCIPELTIGEEEILKIKNQHLEETVNENLKEKEFEINSLQRQISKMKENPFFGMSSEDMEGHMQMYQDWRKLKEQLPSMS